MATPNSLPTATRTLVLATALAVLGLSFVSASLGFAWHNRDLPYEQLAGGGSKWFGTQQAVSAVVFLVPGWYLATKTPESPFGWLLLAAGVGHGVAGIGWGYTMGSELGTGRYPVPWLGLVAAGPGAGIEVPVLAAVVTFFPDGKAPRGWLGFFGVACICLGALGCFLAMFEPLDNLAQDSTTTLGMLRNPLESRRLTDWTQDDILLMAPAGVGTTIVVFARWLTASGELRRLLSWLVYGTLAGVVFAPLVFFGGEWFMLSVQLPSVLFLAALVAATLRHRVLGIELVVSRAFVYAGLVFLVGIIYVSVVGGSILLAGDVDPAASFGAAVLAAFALAPARSRLERGVNHVLFGDRDDPYKVLSAISTRLESAGSLDNLLPDFTEQVAEALRAPFVGIQYLQGEAVQLISSGEPTSNIERFVLSQHGVEIGCLIVGRRRGERAFGLAERELFEQLARQASGALANALLAYDLQRSRERIVTAREEERRRLRRDLHDGLGPALTGAAMMIDAGRTTLRSEPERADTQLANARKEVRSAIDDIRRLVYDLRPPALDELGLAGAVRDLASRSSMTITVEVRGPVESLPAAAEVAAYRIIAEAITNTSRHAAASECAVTIDLGTTLEIVVVDNGKSSGSWRPGVGLISMRERAAELGGTCEAGPAPSGCGKVTANIPIGRLP